MSFDPDDYEIRVRSIEPAYTSTLPRTANRDDTDHEAHLQKIAVEVHLRATRTSSSDYDQMFELQFSVDHDQYEVRFNTVGDAYDKRTSFDPERFYYVSDFGARVVENWLDSVGLDYEPPSQSVTMWDNPPQPTVHTELTIAPEVDDA